MNRNMVNTALQQALDIADQRNVTRAKEILTEALTKLTSSVSYCSGNGMCKSLEQVHTQQQLYCALS